MGIKKVKANTPGRREATFDDFKDFEFKNIIQKNLGLADLVVQELGQAGRSGQ